MQTKLCLYVSKNFKNHEIISAAWTHFITEKLTTEATFGFVRFANRLLYTH